MKWEMKTKPQCIVPWVYLDVLPDGHVVPCCSNTLDLGDLKKQSIGEIWNGEPIKKLRREMFGDALPKTCEVCSYAHSSLKDRYNEIFSDEIGRVDEITSEDGEVSEIKFCGFDFRISNKCNFKCRYCWPKLSSTINQEVKDNTLGDCYENVLNITDYFDLRKFYTDNIDTLKLIEFSGGETLMMDEQYEMLKYLIDNNKTSDIELSYNTNLSILKYKNYNILDYWRKWDPDKLTVHVSLDEIGQRAEYVRSGTVWKNIEQNLKTISDENFIKKVNITVTVFNIFRLPEIITYLIDIGFISDKYNYNNFVIGLEGGMDGGIYNPFLYDQHTRNKIKSKILEFISSCKQNYNVDFSEQFCDLLYGLDNDPYPSIEVIKKFFKKTLSLDKIRNESFLDYVPELKGLLNYLK